MTPIDRYTVEVQEDDSGEFIIELPEDLVLSLGWEENQELIWEMDGESVILKKK